MTYSYDHIVEIVSRYGSLNMELTTYGLSTNDHD